MQILPDGYPVPADAPHRILHVLISDWWNQAWTSKQQPNLAARLREIPAAERIGFLHSGYERLAWFRSLPVPQSREEAARREHQYLFTGALLAAAYRRKLQCRGEDELLALLREARPVCFVTPVTAGPLNLVREYVQKHPWTKRVADALRGYAGRLEGHTCGSCRDARFDLKLFLWMDEWCPIEPQRSWGEWLRQDYRKLPVADRAGWRRLFSRFQARILKRPSQGWFQHMQAGIDELGARKFRGTVRRWLAPLQEATRLEPLDSNLLRNLIWCCTLAPATELDGVIAPLALRTWPKRTGMEKVLEPVEQYMSGRPVATASRALEAIREHRAHKPAPKTPAQLAADYRRKSEARLLEGIDPGGSRVRRDGSWFEVDGSHGSYRFEPETGRLLDRNSGAELEFIWGPSDGYMKSQIEMSLRLKLWAAVVSALLHEEQFGIRLRPKHFMVN